MGFFNNYPYTDFHELNLDWIIKIIKALDDAMDTFTALNKITWAGDWDISKSYPAWSIVADGPDGYISTKPTPAGVTLDNDSYWAHIANYDVLYAAFEERISTLEDNVDTINNEINGIENSINDIINANIYINVMSIEGVNNTGSSDNQTVIQSLLNELHANNKPAKIYFPSGTYNFSVGLVIPSNIELFGDGKNTTLYLTSNGNYTGAVLCVAGNNVYIHDINVEYLTGTTGEILPTGSMMGCIDILTWIYQDCIDAVKNITDIIHEDRYNICIERIYTNAFYALQTEVYLSDGHFIKNIIYRDIYAPNSCISAQNADVDGVFENLLIDNIVCSFLRISRGVEISNCKINNIICNLASITGNADINNLTIVGDTSSKAFTSTGLLTYYYSSALYINNSININNLTIIDADNYTRDIACDASRPIEFISNFKTDRSTGIVLFYGNGICISNYTRKHQNYTFATDVNTSVSGLNYIEQTGDKVRVKLAVYKSDATLSEVCTISADSKPPKSEFKAPCIVTNSSGTCSLGTVIISTTGVVSVTSTWISNIRNAIIDTEYSIL